MRDPLVTHDFAAPLGWRHAHLTTVRSRIRPPRAPADALAATRGIRVDMADGSGDRIRVLIHTPRPNPAPPPAPQLVLLVHGLGGSAESTYVLATAASLLRAGIAVARVDLRGAGSAMAPSTQMYHAGRTEDLRAVLRELARAPEASHRSDPPALGIMGFSLGGNVTLKLLGEPLEGLPVTAGVAVSAPLDLAAGAEHLHHVAFGLYESAMLRGLRDDVQRFAGPLTAEQRTAIAGARRIVEFDEAFTAPLNGWRDAAEYYAASSSGQYLRHIEVPTLVIHAIDDPIVPAGPYRSIDWAALAERGFVHRAITPHGGHVGFHQRGDRPPWYAEQAVSFFRTRTPPATSTPSTPRAH